MTAAFELQLFGFPRLQRHGRPCALGSRKALAILAVLAIEARSPRDRLSAWLWPDVEAAAARRNLRRDLFRLRELGLPVAEDADGGLVLEASVAVDVRRFRQALADGEHGTALQIAARTVLEGLDGVAGPPFDQWLAEQRHGLLQRRQQALQDEAERLAAAGESDAALALWRQALDEDPCHEAALRAAMQRLQIRGERAAALSLYERSAEALRSELGVAPSPAVQALARQLRRDPPSPDARPAAAPAQPAPEPAPATARSLLAERPPFVPRGAPEAALRAACRPGRRIYLSGVPGVGKTRLACECAAHCGAWLRLACLANDSGQPYSTAVRALRSLREAAPDTALPEWVQRELAQLMPELGPPPHALATAEARRRLEAACAEALRCQLQDNFNAVVLDDWQWCDPDSAELLASLGAAGSSVACIVAFRSAQLPLPLLQQLRLEVDGGRADLVELSGLDEHETLALVRALSASPQGERFARRLQQATDGNAFFLLETLRHLFEQGLLREDAGGGWSTPFDERTQDYAELPVPVSVREAVRARARALGDPTRRLLEAASLLGGVFDPALLEGIAPATAAEAVHLLELAEAARLVQPADAGYRFAHDLVRQSLAESLSPARRQWLHGRLALRLAERGGAPALIAAQHEQAGDGTAAVSWRLRAGDAAWRVHALAEARQQYEQALADRPAPDDEVRARLALSRLQIRLADQAAAAAEVDAACAAANRAGAAQRLAALLARAELWAAGDRSDDCLTLLDSLAADLARAPVAERARALTLRSKVLRRRGRHDDARALDEAAIALLESTPEAQRELAVTLNGAARLAIGRGEPLGGEALASRAAAAAEAVDDPGMLAEALSTLGVCILHGRADREAARAVLDRARGVAQACRHVPAQRSAILNLVKIHTDSGDAEAALALLLEGEALAPGFEHQVAEQAFGQARFYVHYLRGQVAEADLAAQRLLALARRIGDRGTLRMSLLMVVDLYLHVDRLDQAQALLAEVEATADAEMPVGMRSMLLAKRAWLHLVRGEPAAAQVLMDQVDRDNNYRFEDKALLAWVGAAVALARGNTDAAADWLHSVDMQAELPTEMLAMLLVQHLLWARAAGRPDDAARQRAESLLGAGRVPALEARRLCEALDLALVKPITAA
ncbi:AAA family ATPase [Aquincola sp. S2]|uniref:AAA family ATPase n=1 Tax=Pseudaquabacterium terrae TaxID=2732868 RepID=A0ABX2ESW2_9BURK|nr:AAA family ATPase [Aquabacterium terrae]NRF71837.1 AAA family ATPase [Aquabacterium terrae]